MNMQILCGLMVLYTSATIIGLFLIAYELRIKNKESQERRLLDERQLLYTMHIDNNDMDILDQLIMDSVTDYRILNIDYDPQFYMNSNEEQKMLKTVLEDVLTKLSPIILERLSLLYNKDKLEDIIFKKVSMAILSCKVEINGNFKE